MSNAAEQELKQWARQLSQIHLPRWEQLPDIDLYMDQVVTLIERYLGFLIKNSKDKIITNSMVNNYVKLNLIPAPHKKQYNRVHLAYLIAITILKQVVTIKEVKDGILQQSSINGTKNAYNQFCLQQELEFQRIASQILDGEIQAPIQEMQIPFQDLALKMASVAFAGKITAEKVVALQNGEGKEFVKSERKIQ